MKTISTKLLVVLPVVIGLVLGAGFFILGYTQDAPGACAIGLAIAFTSVMIATRNAGIIKKGWLVPILLLSYSIAAGTLNTVLILDGEFDEYPNMAYIGYLLSSVMLIVGILLALLNKKRFRH